MDNSGLSQAKFAESVGIHPVSFCNYLKDDSFSPKMVQRIADKLNIPYTDLLPDDAKETIAPSVTGYLEYKGEITKIKDLKGLKKFVEKVEYDMGKMNVKQVKLPKQKPITLDDIDLAKREEYDASLVEIKSFRHNYDVVDNGIFALGNMCGGYPFLLNGVPFNNSEAAYIAGLFSDNTTEHIRVQKLLTENNDGYAAKKEIRKRNEVIARSKEDWEQFNVEWMKYVVWQKCKGNKDFANLLKKIPDETMIVENSTGMTGATADFWGCFNPELEAIRDAKEELFKRKYPKAKKEELNAERNKWHNFGIWRGTNEMGKILKMCSICLKQGVEMPIDYALLNSKHIFLLGKEIHFEREFVSVVPLSEPKQNKTAKTPRQIKEVKPQYDIRCSDEGYAYFYMNVPLCNWWDSVPAIQYDGHAFNSSESIFMYLKAKYFGDEETAAKIVEMDNKTDVQVKDRCRAIKKLGEKVKGLDDSVWAGPNRKAMKTALTYKAMYDEEFKKVLLDPQYAGMTFCEASKYDKIWGIGIDAKTAMKVGRAGWKGHNFLGRALTELRNELRPDLKKVRKNG